MEITTRMFQEDRINGERINGLFHLLLNSVYWGYNPLILTFDPNLLGHPSMRKFMEILGQFLGKSLPRHPVPPSEVWYLDPTNIPKTPNLRRYDWMSIGYGSGFTIVVCGRMFQNSAWTPFIHMSRKLLLQLIDAVLPTCSKSPKCTVVIKSL